MAFVGWLCSGRRVPCEMDRFFVRHVRPSNDPPLVRNFAEDAMPLRSATREFRAAANVCKLLCERRTVPLDGVHLWRTWNARVASLGSFASMVLGLDPCVPIPYEWHVLSFPPVPPSPARQCCEKVCMGISVQAPRSLPLHNTAARAFPPHTSGSDRSLRKGRTVRLIGGRTGKRSGSCGFSQGLGLGGEGSGRPSLSIPWGIPFDRTIPSGDPFSDERRDPWESLPYH